MATLTEVSVISRKIIKYGAIGMVIIALIPLGVRITKSIYLQLNPPPPPPPTLAYGKLPKLIFPVSTESQPTYKLETIQGTLPDLPNTGRVYVVGINKSRLLALDRIREKMRNLGFLTEPQELDDRTYRFTQANFPVESIVNIISGGFAYRYDWTTNSLTATTYNAPTAVRAIAEAKTFLLNLGLLPDDLGGGTAKTLYLIATGSAMVPIDSQYQANFTGVDLYRADKDEMKFVTTGGDTSPVSVVFSGLEGNKRVVAANYQYSPILDDGFATYPLRSVEAAWQELNQGGAYIAKRTVPEVVIRRVYIAYYESSDPQEFIQPVYVFEGDGGFLAYVHAIDPGNVQE